MHSGSLEKVGTPRKRTLSRGMSEDESLRHLIKEAEGSAKRLTRTDSKLGSLKKPPQGEKQAEEDLINHFPEMLDLQESYDEVVQELRGLEVQRETLFFQVDCLQDALEGAEEMLAEARREADSANEELERERQAKRRLEESVDSLKEMVGALTEEIQRLKEERFAIPTVPVYALVTDSRPEEEGEEKREGAREEDHKEDRRKEEEPEVAVDALEEASEWVDAPDAPLTLVRLDSAPSPPAPGPREGEAETTAGGILASFFRKGREEQPAEGGRPALHAGSSVDSEDGQASGEGDSPGPLIKIQRMFTKTFGQPAAAQDEALSREGGAPRGAEPLPGLADGLAGETPMSTPDEFPRTAPGLGWAPPQQDVPGEDRQGSESGGEDGARPPGEALGPRDGAEPGSPKSPDSCVVS
ncbi:myristoylated alanine-rich C-kinase substrate [Anguilla rostrata]|uniref:myristoylated alanine-rich C-kinase substrate n=1 Tax=Anguilla rostrata TaxID=7938 RepID=UPI0030D1190C